MTKTISSPADEPEGVKAVLEVRKTLHLVPNPLQEVFFPRETATDVKKLADKILANGLENPIEIDPEGTILVGHRRRMALLWLKASGHQQFETTEVLVRYDLAALGPNALKKRFLEENCERRQLTPLRLAMVSRALYEAEATGRRDDTKLKQRIAGQFTVSARTLERWWALLDLPPELFSLVALKKLPQQVAQLVLKHATPDEIEELRQAAEEDSDEDVVSRARKLANSRREMKPRKIDPAKAFDRFLSSGLDISAFYAAIASYLTKLDHGIKLGKYRFEMRRIMDAVSKVLALLESHPELENVIDDRPLEWSTLTWDEHVHGIREELNAIDSQGLKDDGSVEAPSLPNTDPPSAKPEPPRLVLKKQDGPPPAPRKDLAPLPKLRKVQAALPPLVLKKQPPPAVPVERALPPLKLRSLPGDFVPTSSS